MAISLQGLANASFAGNTGAEYVFAAGVFVAAYVVLWIFKRIILSRVKAFACKTNTDIDDLLVGVVDAVGWPFYIFLSLYAAVQFLSGLPDVVPNVLNYAVIVVALFYAVKALQAFIDYGKRKIIEKRKEEEKVEDVSLIKMLADIIKGLVWIGAILFLLANMGYDISAFIAGLGIGGIAIALALQNILEDLFSSLSIYFDKPFKVGDFIIVGSDLGTVKKIGIKTTRLQHLQGQELVISNRELTSTRINNYGRMEKRRIVFGFGVTYDTPVAKLEKIPGMVKDLVEAVELTTFDRAHFKEFGNSALTFEVVYYVATGDYNVYMDVQQSINLALTRAFEEAGIDFAYPTQTLYVKKE